ncbi:hypothetical protein BGK67_31205 [Streptomyces subrutilus]|uniref:Uncharacterized protein n=1 Tax=Streptomyces subrutilus TaxID=36818 RepID=A0A1E5Q0D6_9ACTN|nr:hypothetical protein BGK67_31205 [Streptomyces subrutilus]
MCQYGRSAAGADVLTDEQDRVGVFVEFVEHAKGTRRATGQVRPAVEFFGRQVAERAVRVGDPYLGRGFGIQDTGDHGVRLSSVYQADMN